MPAATFGPCSPAARAASAYRRAARQGKRYSWLVDEPVEVHPGEGGALRGECPPRRFRWRGRWHRASEVSSVWRDGRPSRRRTYVYLSAGAEGYFEMYFDGVWRIYRRIEVR
jgi:hypothetical protein